jgi:hypothetical protein
LRVVTSKWLDEAAELQFNKNIHPKLLFFRVQCLFVCLCVRARVYVCVCMLCVCVCVCVCVEGEMYLKVMLK